MERQPEGPDVIMSAPESISNCVATDASSSFPGTLVISPLSLDNERTVGMFR